MVWLLLFSYPCYIYLHKCWNREKNPYWLPNLGRINGISECMSCFWYLPRAAGERLTIETKQVTRGKSLAAYLPATWLHPLQMVFCSFSTAYFYDQEINIPWLSVSDRDLDHGRRNKFLSLCLLPTWSLPTTTDLDFLLSITRESHDHRNIPIVPRSTFLISL